LKCGGNVCYEAIRVLLGTLFTDDDYSIQKGCDIIDLTYTPNSRQTVELYPCYRDYMVIKAASVL